MALPNQQTVDYPSCKLVIVGDGRTGKTTFVKRSSMVQVDGVAPDKPRDSAVPSRMKQFSAVNKLKKMATTKEFTVQKFRLRSNYYNYMVVLLTAYYTAGPLFRLVMGILALTLEGQTGGLAPFEMVSLIIEAFAWYSMLGVETKVYISCSGGTADLGSFMLW
ncbi:hypothetical protein CsSME_00027766 [Camellia sinensis var. sinensis]